MKFRYCPVCGSSIDWKPECPFCHHAVVETEKDAEYYIARAKETYTPNSWEVQAGGIILDIAYEGAAQDIAFEEEYKHNPLFDESARKASLEWDKELYESMRKETLASHSSPSYSTPASANLPTCPICHSTNLKKISAVKAAAHWYAFGLLSKTARSQWECKNCGTKF